jgi:hypothetical protein
MSVRLRSVRPLAAARAGVRPKPHVYACTHLANSASLLLPVSNLTNLLARTRPRPPEGRYGLSDRDVEELLAERGIAVDHVTAYRWVQRFTPAVR